MTDVDAPTGRTVRDLVVAVRRSPLLIGLAVALGLAAGLLLRPSTEAQSVYLLRLHDDAPAAIALELPPSVMLDITPSAVAADVDNRLDALLPDRDRSIGISLFADNAARTVEITITAPSSEEAADAGAQLAAAVVADLRTRQEDRWNSVTSYHAERIAEIDERLAGTTADTDRALYLVERAGHLDALGGIRTLATGNPVEDPILDVQPTDSGGPGLSVAVAGAFLGLALGLLIVYLRLMNDRSVRRASELERASGTGVVGVLSGPSEAPVAAAAYTALASAISKRYPAGSTVLVTSPTEPEAAQQVARGVNAALVALDRAGSIVVEAGPPLGTGAEAVQRALSATATMLVARSGSTQHDDIRAAVRILETAGAPILGAVLCDVPRRELAWATDAAGATR